MSLFAEQENENRAQAQPLAARMRPRDLSEFVGQRHMLAPDGVLRQLIRADRLGSLILFGPPGTGKTSLAHILAHETKRTYEELNAVLHGVKELRDVLHAARDRVSTTGRGTLLFIDEIHRFNRAQQDALLADVEQGVVTLIGATTSNPFFALSGALISRSQLFELRPLDLQDIIELLRRSLDDRQRGLGRFGVKAAPEALERIAELSNGDARQALAVLEVAALAAGSAGEITVDSVNKSVLTRAQVYDVGGDEHYDCASALIKSVRGSDPDAAIYWLARMLEGGEDVRFLCRRLVILASEDIGNADPQALPLAVSCFQACEQVGLPECQFALAQVLTYLACAPKSNAATVAISLARNDVREKAVLPVPTHLRDGHYAGAEKLGRGTGYHYSHNAPEGVAQQDYLGVDRLYYQPVDRGYEAELAVRLRKLREQIRGQARPE